MLFRSLQKMAGEWKAAQFKQKKEKFTEKSKEEGWNIHKSTQEDIEFLFEEFEILELLKPLNKLGCSSFDELKPLKTGGAVGLLEIDYFKASKLVFSIEMIENGIYSKEDKEKHLKNCAICRMGVKKGLEEYGVPVNLSAAIAEKFGGMNLGEIKNLAIADFPSFGIEKSAWLGLGKAIQSMKDIHSFA